MKMSFRITSGGGGVNCGFKKRFMNFFTSRKPSTKAILEIFVELKIHQSAKVSHPRLVFFQKVPPSLSARKELTALCFLTRYRNYWPPFKPPARRRAYQRILALLQSRRLAHLTLKIYSMTWLGYQTARNGSKLHFALTPTSQSKHHLSSFKFHAIFTSMNFFGPMFFSAQSACMKIGLHQALRLSILLSGKSVVLHLLEAPKLRKHYWEDREEKKAQHLADLNPLLQGLRSISVLHTKEIFGPVLLLLSLRI